MIATEIEKLYRETQKHCGIEIGDKVKILRSFYMGEMGFSQSWNDNMNQTIGLMGTVFHVLEDIDSIGVSVKLPNGKIVTWCYPWFVLEVVEKSSNNNKNDDDDEFDFSIFEDKSEEMK